MLTLDLNVSAGRAFTAIGIIGGPTESFTTSTLSATTSNLGGVDNTYTLTFRPSSDIVAGATITLSGLTGSQTSNNASLTIAGAGASLFGSSANWTQSSGSLVLTVDTGQTVPNGSDTVITFVLANPASSAGVTSVNLSSASYATATISGLFLASAANKYNIPDSTDQQTEATILALTPTNPAGEVTVKFGSDTHDLYVWDGSSWYRYDNFNSTSVSFDGSNDYGQSYYVASSSITAISYSFWMKSSDTTSSMTLGLSDYGSLAKSFRIITPSGTKAFYVIINDGTGNYLNNNLGGQDATISGSTNIRDDLWHHVVFTVSGTSVKIYIDGGDSAINGSNTSNSEGSALSATSTKSYAGGANSFVLARNGTHSSYYYDGLMDEVAIFEYELSSSQVRTIYNSGIPSDLSSYSPSAWWRMGEKDGATGTTITDQGSGGNNLTLVNGPTFSTTTPS